MEVVLGVVPHFWGETPQLTQPESTGAQHQIQQMLPYRVRVTFFGRNIFLLAGKKNQELSLSHSTAHSSRKRRSVQALAVFPGSNIRIVSNPDYFSPFTPRFRTPILSQTQCSRQTRNNRQASGERHKKKQNKPSTFAPPPTPAPPPPPSAKPLAIGRYWSVRTVEGVLRQKFYTFIGKLTNPNKKPACAWEQAIVWRISLLSRASTGQCLSLSGSGQYSQLLVDGRGA